jgi:hypothetical protein
MSSAGATIDDATTVAAPSGSEPPPTEPATWQRVLSRWSPLIVPPLLYAMTAAYYFSRFLAHPSRGVPGGADGIIYAWYFEWIKQAFVHLHNPFFTDALNAPAGVNVMWNTAVFALAVVCIPLTALIGAGPTVGLMMVLAPIASASTAYFVLRRLTGKSIGPALAAALYGFGPYFVGQNGHLHLTIAVFPPLLLLLGHELLVVQGKSARRTGLWLGLATGIQLLLSEEVVVLGALVAVFAVAALAALHPRQVAERVRHAAVGLGVGAVTAVVIAGIPLAYQFYGKAALPHGVVASGQRLDLAGIVRPGVLQYYAGHDDIAANATFPANGVENTGYLGWPLLVLALGICAWLIVRRERAAYWWLITAVVTVALSLGTPIDVNGHRVGGGPWGLLRKLPLLDGTVVVRFTLITTLLVALILAWGLARLRGRAFAVGVVVVAAALIPLRPANRYDGILDFTPPRFFTTSAVKAIPSGSRVYVMPYLGRPQPAARVMAWQLRTHLRFDLIGGYSVFNYNGQMSYVAALPKFAFVLSDVGTSGTPPNAADLAAGRASVAPSGVRVIVITDQQPNAALVAQTAARLTGCRPRRVADVTLCELPPEGTPPR